MAGGALSEPIIRAIDHVEERIDAPLALADLAAAAGLSRFHFHRRFRDETGEPPAAFVERLRLERAALLLTAREYSITDLAWEVGFRNPETLARRFRARFGVTAGAWRRRQLALWKKLGLTPGTDPMGAEDAIEIRRLPRFEVAVRRTIGDEEPLTGVAIGMTFDWPGITPAGRVRQDRGCRADAADEPNLARRSFAGGLHAALEVEGDEVPNQAYQRLYVRSLGGRYRLRPGPLVEIRRRDGVIVYQPVEDIEEGAGDVRMRA